MSEEKKGVEHDGDGGGGAHASMVSVEFGFAVDAKAGGFDGAHHSSGEFVVIGGGGPFGEFFIDDADGEGAGDLSGGGSAHAVADGQQGAVGTDDMQMVLVFGAARFFGEVSDDIAVLVVLADASDIGTTEDMETDVSRLGWRSLSHLTFEFSHPYASSTRNKCCPTRMESPSCRAQSPRIATNEPFDEFKSSSVKVPEELDRRMTACLLDK